MPSNLNTWPDRNRPIGWDSKAARACVSVENKCSGPRGLGCGLTRRGTHSRKAASGDHGNVHTCPCCCCDFPWSTEPADVSTRPAAGRSNLSGCRHFGLQDRPLHLDPPQASVLLRCSSRRDLVLLKGNYVNVRVQEPTLMPRAKFTNHLARTVNDALEERRRRTASSTHSKISQRGQLPWGALPFCPVLSLFVGKPKVSAFSEDCANRSS